MSKYNLIRNSVFTEVTDAGTGNRELSYDELLCLYDNNTTTSGVVLESTDVLFIDIDLCDRIRIDSLIVYINTVGDRATALNSFHIQYKNSAEDTYMELDKSYDTTTFYANNLPTLFAPRYLRLIFNSIQAEVYEISVLNEDYCVAFGEDGSMIDKFVDSSSEYTIVPIFNNSPDSTGPKIAYVVVDCNDFEVDSCLSLSENPSGPYKSLYDGVHIGNRSIDYKFDKGKLNNCVVKDGSVVISPVETVTDVFHTVIDIPLVVNPTYKSDTNGWGVSNSAWDWNSYGDIYAMGIDYGAADLKLFILNQVNFSWLYVSKICQSSSGSTWSMMVCMGDYIYAVIDSSGKFGRYNLKGVQNNWEDLATCSLGTLSKIKQSMCSDKERYIYVVAENISTTPKTQGFVRYDILTNTWTTLANYYQCAGSTSTTNIDVLIIYYSHEDDTVILDQSGLGTADAKRGYLQKYFPLTNTWNGSWNVYSTTYLDYRVSGYYGGYVVFSEQARTSNILTVLNIFSGKATEIPIPYKNDSDSVTYLLCAPIDGGNSVGVFLADFNEANQPANICLLIKLGPVYKENMEGTYTTPVMSMGDNLYSSFFYTDTTLPGESKITWSDTLPVPTVMVRSSNTEPLTYSKIFYYYAKGLYTADRRYVMVDNIVGGNKNDMYLNAESPNTSTSYLYQFVPINILFDSTDGSLLICTRQAYNGAYVFYIERYDLRGKSKRHALSISASATISLFTNQGVDSGGCVWFYTGVSLLRYSYDLSTKLVEIKEDNSEDFLYRMSVGPDSTTCWYTNDVLNKLVNINESGSVVCSIPLGAPRNLFALGDGGCIVDDENANKIIRYNNLGTLVSEVSYAQDLTMVRIAACISDSTNMSFWLLLDTNKIVRMDFSGTIICEVQVISASHLKPFYGGLLIWSSSNKTTLVIDNYGNTISSSNLSNLDVVGASTVPIPISLTHDQIVDKGLHHLYDIESDIGWDNTTWVEVPLSNHGLPFAKYHQFKFKLMGDGIYSPKLNDLVIPTPVQIKDIYPQTSKNLYIKTDYPTTSLYKQYNSKLKCWWKN